MFIPNVEDGRGKAIAGTNIEIEVFNETENCLEVGEGSSVRHCQGTYRLRQHSFIVVLQTIC